MKFELAPLSTNAKALKSSLSPTNYAWSIINGPIAAIAAGGVIVAVATLFSASYNDEQVIGLVHRVACVLMPFLVAP